MGEEWYVKAEEVEHQRYYFCQRQPFRDLLLEEQSHQLEMRESREE